jgi:preprotein translocase subunit SecE
MAVAKEKEKEQRDKAARSARTGSGGGGSRTPASREQRENVLVRTFRETRTELRKVVWPTREETIRLTMVVIAISSVIGLILFLGDSLFLALYGLLVSLVSS